MPPSRDGMNDDVAAQQIAWVDWTREDGRGELQRLIREALTAARAEERERCARIADDFSWQLPMFLSASDNEISDAAACAVMEQIAAAIRHLPITSTKGGDGE